jgi:predicted alpha/beta hydrolase family esterase
VLTSWAPIALHTLPFKTQLVASHNDPYCSFERASAFAKAWGSELIDLGERGHINAQSGLGDWPQGLALLNQLKS